MEPSWPVLQLAKALDMLRTGFFIFKCGLLDIVLNEAYCSFILSLVTSFKESGIWLTKLTKCGSRRRVEKEDREGG